MPDSDNACAPALPEFSRILERQAAFDEVYRNLEHYEATRTELENCINGATALREAAFGAEMDARILIALALDSLNEASVSGVLAELQNSEQTAGPVDLDAALLECKSFFRSDERFRKFDTRFFDRARGLVQTHRILAQRSRTGYQISFVDPSGRAHTQDLTFGSIPGTSARVSVDQFFGPNGPVISQVTGFVDSNECRRQMQSLPAHDGRIILPAYGLMLTGLTLLRDSMYQHARIVGQYGRAHMVAEDPLTVAGIVALIAGISAAFGGVGLANSCKQVNLPDTICKGAAAVLIVIGLALTGLGARIVGGALLVIIGGGNQPPQGGPQPPGPPANLTMPV